MPSVIPDDKTIRKQYFYQTPSSQPTSITDTDYTGRPTDSRTKAHSAHRLETSQMWNKHALPSTTDGVWTKYNYNRRSV